MQTGLLLALLVLICGTAAVALAVGGRSRWRLPGVALASGGAACWLTVDKGLEGPVLLDLPGPHGLVLADLLVLPALGLCLVLLAGELRTRRGPAAPETSAPGPQGVPGRAAVEADPAPDVSRTGRAGPG